jgi:hypothetical protein
VKRGGGPPLPPGASLTAIFDSCNSGTLLGNISSIHSHHPLLLTPRKISTIVSATTYIARGSTRENLGAEPSEKTSVSRHHASITCRRSSLYPFAQLGRTAEALVLGPRNDDVPQMETGATRKPSASPAFSSLYGRWRYRYLTSTMGKGVRPQNASLGARGGVVRRCRGSRCLNTLMWCAGLLTILPSLRIYTPASRRYPSRLPMTVTSLWMQVRIKATVSQ